MNCLPKLKIKMGHTAKEIVLLATKGNLLTYSGYLLLVTQGFESQPSDQCSYVKPLHLHTNRWHMSFLSMCLRGPVWSKANLKS